MYIQITTRCNMTCAHCCFSCTAKGEDMSFETFKSLVDNYGDECITLGGGEPTIHPEFEKILLYAISAGEVWLATNGKKKSHALLLAKLTKAKVLTAELSIDDYHDQVDWEVQKAFEDLNSIRNVSAGVKRTGRAAEELVYVEEGCACENIIAKPDGTFRWCGCDNAPEVDMANLPEAIFDRPCYKEEVTV